MEHSEEEMKCTMPSWNQLVESVDSDQWSPEAQDLAGTKDAMVTLEPEPCLSEEKDNINCDVDPVDSPINLPVLSGSEDDPSQTPTALADDNTFVNVDAIGPTPMRAPKPRSFPGILTQVQQGVCLAVPELPRRKYTQARYAEMLQDLDNSILELRARQDLLREIRHLEMILKHYS